MEYLPKGIRGKIELTLLDVMASVLSITDYTGIILRKTIEVELSHTKALKKADEVKIYEYFKNQQQYSNYYLLICRNQDSGNLVLKIRQNIEWGL